MREPEPWLHDAWYVADWSETLKAGALHARTLLGEPLVIFRDEDGALSALEDRCCHRLAPLSKGRLEPDGLRCMYHGMKFAPDGRCIEIPGQGTIPDKARVRRYPMLERGCWAWIWMGDPQTADPDLVPASIAREDPAWRLATGTLDFEADYRLLNDNLLDLSHLSYAHENTLGWGAPHWADNRPRLTTHKRGLRFERWNENAPGHGKVRQHGETFDVFNAYDFMAPGIFLQRTAWYPAGHAARLEQAAPDPADAYFVRLDEQAVTPLDARRTRYFYAAGGPADQVDDNWAARNLAFTERAFHEDKEIIEAQQQVIDRDPGHPMLTTSFDGGPIRFRRLMDGLIAGQDRPG